MTMWKEGERMKYQEDGRVFKISKITPDFVVLRALEGSTQILTQTSSLGLLFERLPPADPGKNQSAGKQTTDGFSKVSGTEATA
jgi:hypothetical protein